MLTNVETLFDNQQEMMKHLKKKSYEQNMKEFLGKNQHYFTEMNEYMATAEDKEKAAKELGTCFVDSVEKKFAKGKKGKIPSPVQADLNMFVIYYVFPAILKTGHADSKVLADGLCNAWRERFKGGQIGYTDYDTIYNSFREKIFGIF